MNIKIIAVGKIKEDYVKSAVNEYIYRLSPYYRLTVAEIPAEQINDESLAEKYKETEGDKILSAIKPDSYVITLEILGKMLSSTELAQKLKEITNITMKQSESFLKATEIANALKKQLDERIHQLKKSKSNPKKSPLKL